MTTILVRKCCAVINRKLVPTVATLTLVNLSRSDKCRKIGEVPKTMLRKTCILAGFGNPLLDITVKIHNDELLKKYNLNNDDQKEISIEEMKNLLKDINE